MQHFRFPTSWYQVGFPKVNGELSNEERHAFFINLTYALSLTLDHSEQTTCQVVSIQFCFMLRYLPSVQLHIHSKTRCSDFFSGDLFPSSFWSPSHRLPVLWEHFNGVYHCSQHWITQLDSELNSDDQARWCVNAYYIVLSSPPYSANSAPRRPRLAQSNTIKACHAFIAVPIL